MEVISRIEKLLMIQSTRLYLRKIKLNIKVSTLECIIDSFSRKKGVAFEYTCISTCI